MGVRHWTFLARPMSMTFSDQEDFARKLDAEDPLRAFRERFYLPLGKNGEPLIYFAGNSLGLMPKSARVIVEEELNNWAKLGVDAHHATGAPWYTYHEALREKKKELISNAFREAKGNYVETAKILDVHPNYLHRLIRTLDMKSILEPDR